MVLAVAVIFIGFQAVPVLPAVVSPSVVSAPVPEETADKKLVNPMANTSISRADDLKTPEESSSTSSAARLRLDSIYADDKGRQPAVAPISIAQNAQSFSTIRIQES